MKFLPNIAHHANVFLADADLVPTLDSSSDGWGGLLALFMLVVTILFAVYIAARQEWQFAQDPNLRGDASLGRRAHFKAESESGF